MFSDKFILLLVLSFFLGIASLVTVLLMWNSGFSFWFWHIWFRSFIVAAGIDFSLVFFYGWDYLNPTETRLPVYLGLGAALLIGLIYQGITLIM